MRRVHEADGAQAKDGSVINIIRQFAIQAGLLALIVAGHVYEIDGARNLAAFVIWALLLPAAVLVNADGVIKAVAKDPKKPSLWRWLSRPMQLAGLGTLIWFGAPVTAAAYAVSMLLIMAAHASIEKVRAAA